MSAPDRLLDFIVLGAARSGTTALGDAMSLMSGVFCATEFLSDVAADHSTLAMPATLVERGHPAVDPRKGIVNRRKLMRKLEEGPVRLYGNKQPDYTRVMDALHRQLPDATFVCIFRSPSEIAQSWQRRADSAEDPLWPAGRNAAVAVVDWLLLMHRLTEAPYPITMVDYTTAFYRDAELLPRLLAMLGVPADAAYRQAFREKIFREGQAPRTRTDPLGDFLGSLGVRQIEAMFAAAPLAPAAGFVPALRDWLAAHADAVLHRVAEDLAAAPTEVGAGAIRYLARLLSGWDRREGPSYDLLARTVPALQARMPEAAAFKRRASPLVRAFREAAQLLAEARDLAEENRLSEATEAARSATALPTGDARFPAALGEILTKAGRHAEAVEAWREALARRPGDARFQTALDRSLARSARRK